MRLPAVNEGEKKKIKLSKRTSLQQKWSWMSVYFIILITFFLSSKSIS